MVVAFGAVVLVDTVLDAVAATLRVRLGALQPAMSATHVTATVRLRRSVARLAIDACAARLIRTFQQAAKPSGPARMSRVHRRYTDRTWSTHTAVTRAAVAEGTGTRRGGGDPHQRGGCRRESTPAPTRLATRDRDTGVVAGEHATCCCSRRGCLPPRLIYVAESLPMFARLGRAERPSPRAMAGYQCSIVHCAFLVLSRWTNGRRPADCDRDPWTCSSGAVRP